MPTRTEYGLKNNETGVVRRWRLSQKLLEELDPQNYAGFTVVTRTITDWEDKK